MVVTLRTCIYVAIIAALGHGASAEPQRVLVVDFEGGAKARELQEQVVKLIASGELTVVSVRKTDPAELDDIATKLSANARIGGKLALDRRKHFILTVTVAGEPLSTLDLGRASKLGKAASLSLKQKLLGQLKTPPATPVVAAIPEPEPAPAAIEPVIEVAKPVALPKQGAAKFENFARVRSALPANLITLRGYWDSREVVAAEQVIGFRAPLDFSYFGRTTLRSDTGDDSDLDIFTIDALAFSPMLYSFGLVAGIAGSSGPDNDVLRPGIAQTLFVVRGPFRMLSFLAFEPYQTSGPGGRLQALVAVTLGRWRSEVVGVYGWPALSSITDPNILVVRPDLRVQLWKSFGLYGQYEYNNALPTGKEGLRFGGELSGLF
ncbi:MAG: hypothetical protein ABI867_05230 [Kofleriaceae bacterium]